MSGRKSDKRRTTKERSDTDPSKAKERVTQTFLLTILLRYMLIQLNGRNARVTLRKQLNLQSHFKQVKKRVEIGRGATLGSNTRCRRFIAFNNMCKATP
jgi:hypothetical protein